MCEQCLSIARVYLSMFLKAVILHTLEVNRGSCDLVNMFDLVTSAATHPPGRLPGDLLLTKPWPFCFYSTSLLDWLGSVFEQLIINSILVLWLPYDCHVTAHVAAAYYAFLFSSQSAVFWWLRIYCYAGKSWIVGANNVMTSCQHSQIYTVSTLWIATGIILAPAVSLTSTKELNLQTIAHAHVLSSHVL